MNKSKRLGIFIFFDKQGIVDEYVKFLLSDIVNVLDELVIICNGTLSSDGRQILDLYSKKIVIRENTGFDATAWKEALCIHVGWKHIYEFNELVLFNDTFFGPFIKFSEIFRYMKEKECDFWGFTSHFKTEQVTKTGIHTIPTHLQSYFLVIRHNLLLSASFRCFWETLPKINTFEDAVLHFETRFTDYFSQRGFKWSTFVEMSDLEETVEKSINLNAYYVSYMLQYRNLPVIKKKDFGLDKKIFLTYNEGEECRKRIEYVRKCTSYNEFLIWQNILRHHDISDLYRNLSLDYIVTPDPIHTHQIQQKNIKILIFAKNFNTLQTNWLCKLASELNFDIDLIVIDDINVMTSYKYNRGQLTNFSKDITCIKTTPDRNIFSNVSTFELQNYDYLCFIPLDQTENSSSFVFNETINNLLFDNLLHSASFITKVIKTFEKEANLGILFPPAIYAGMNFGSLGNTWGNKSTFSLTKEEAKHLGIDSELSYDKPPFATGPVFWCRTSAILDFLQKIAQQNCPHPQKLFIYAAQQNGYYSGILYNSNSAMNDLSNYKYMLTRILQLTNINNHRSFMQWECAYASAIKYTNIVMTIKHAIKTFLLFLIRKL